MYCAWDRGWNEGKVNIDTGLGQLYAICRHGNTNKYKDDALS
jgi:hypothetical protein